MYSIPIRVFLSGAGSELADSLRSALHEFSSGRITFGSNENDCDALLVVEESDAQVEILRHTHPWRPIVVLTENDDPAWALHLVRYGADEVLPLSGVPEGVRSIYRALRFSLERRKVDKAESLRRGVLFQTQKMEAVGRLASGVAHDFKHLVQIVVGNCSLLQRLHHDQDPALLEKVADIRNASDKALALVDKLLKLASGSSYKGRLTNFFQVISGYLPILRSANVNAEFRVECRGDLAPFAVDPTAVEQVLLNLVLNALDAVGKAGLVFIECDSLEFTHDFVSQDLVLPAGHYAVLEVSDTGGGIRAEDLAKIFEPFYTSKGAQGGTGLGLATVSSILRNLGGGIMVASEPGSPSGRPGLGTTFKAFFPMPRQELLAPPVVEEPTKKKVLLVEQREVDRLGLRVRLEELGGSVIEASSVSDALRLLEVDSPDLVVADAHVLLGEASKLEARTPTARRLVTSAFSSGWLRQRGFVPPGWEFLPKPWSERQLSQALQ